MVVAIDASTWRQRALGTLTNHEVPEPVESMRVLVSDASAYRQALYNRLVGLVEQYNSIEEFPAKLVVLDFPRRVWRSREEIECSIRELIEILGLPGGYEKKRDVVNRISIIVPKWGAK